MKNTEIGFNSFKQFGYFSLHSGGNGNTIEVFRLFSMYLNDKVFKYLKKRSLFFVKCNVQVSSVTFHMYLDIGGDDGKDYNDGKSSDEDYYE